jgi:hypothetical protein
MQRQFPVVTHIERMEMANKWQGLDLDEEEVRRYWSIFGRDIHRDIDGYFVFLPSRVYGVLDERCLVYLAGLLKIANYTWDKSIQDYFKHEAERKSYG